ncbi:hypothetical protein [uncultured Anaerococcus sp.]|uniref:hypothetical protein n=1 Tax=uncultured Anaerococcus sp. TaxID=293428 RepID=UPI00288AA89F|nr:hypothetical protein [uncultured Anaerococcus sp.]
MTDKNKKRVEEPLVYEQTTSSLQAGKNLSWASIFAGAVSSAAVFTVLSLLTAALGFGLFSPQSSDPLSGVGIGTGIWTIITLVLSFCAGGFIAGYSARSTGLLHGAITWALTILLLFTLIFNAVASALGLAGNVFTSVVSTAGNAAGNVANVASDAVSAGLEKAGSSIADVDTKQLQSEVEQYLTDTDVPELKPDYIEGQLQESRDEITQAVKDIALNPSESDKIIEKLTNSLSEKAKKIADSADKDAIDNALANNTQLSQDEASQVSQNIYDGLKEASKSAEESLDKASEEISKLSSKANKEIDQTVENVKEGADKASTKASVGSILVFLGLVLALVVSAYAGKLGERKAKEFVRK